MKVLEQKLEILTEAVKDSFADERETRRADAAMLAVPASESFRSGEDGEVSTVTGDSDDEEWTANYRRYMMEDIDYEWRRRQRREEAHDMFGTNSDGEPNGSFPDSDDDSFGA